MSTSVRCRLSLVTAAFILIPLAACGGSPQPPGDTTLPPLSTRTPAEPSAPTEEIPAEAALPDTPVPTEPPLAAPTAAVPEAATEPAVAAATVALPVGAPADAQPLEVVGSGFGVGQFGAGWGLVVRNPNTVYALVDSRYTLTARDANGNSLATEEGSLPLLLPGQRLGVGGALQVDDEEAVAALEVAVQMGEFITSQTSSLITAEDVIYTAGNFSDEVSGTLVNGYAAEIAGVRVAAVAFDADDNVIGGGVTLLEALPPLGSTAVVVPVTVGGQVARVELFAVLEELPE